MPYPNEHAARLTDPDKYERFTRTNDKFKTGIHAIWGWLKGKSELQAIRFDAKLYTPAEAKKWLKDHDFHYILFEEATNKKNTDMNLQRGYGCLRQIPEDVETTRIIPFVASDGSKDRHESIINPKGWVLENYRKNPIIGYMHDIYGGWIKSDPDNIIGVGDIRQEDDRLLVDIKFEPAAINPLAEKIFRKVLHGSIRSVSVWFYPLKSHKGDDEKGEEKGVLYYDSTELVEVSVVNIPSNVNAVKNAALEEKFELTQYILRQALDDKYDEALTIKGIYAILQGKEPEKVLQELGARPKNINYLLAKQRLLKFMEV
jgi:HK97 family phage prohead protease